MTVPVTVSQTVDDEVRRVAVARLSAKLHSCQCVVDADGAAKVCCVLRWNMIFGVSSILNFGLKILNRVATNLENMEYSGSSTIMENLGNCVTSWKIFNIQNSLSLIKYLHNTTRSWASNEQSLVKFGDGHSALVTCYIAGVDVK